MYLEKLKIFLELSKIKITLFVTITASFGFIAYRGSITAGIILPTLGTLLLACGSAAYNHYQERFTDALMERTKSRPIPSGKISASTAYYFAAALVLIGSMILLIGANLTAMILGLLNLFWYNFIYTPLKRKSALAIIPGSLVGAIPPAIGWVAAGGSLLAPQIIILSFFFFIWQIPHFWLLLLVLDKDYQKAGLPTLTRIFSHRQLTRITFVWIVATIVTGLLIPLFGIIHLNWIIYSMFLAGVYLTWKAARLLRFESERTNYRFAFNSINIFALFVVAAVSIDKLIF
ncbi:MAG TPA: protoheme IX farnesyltransferase [Ignavibacteriaceae bacterium]|nr:protoheme IX farnesyltransferase [Ignavibacteriaceae bacterium]